ncbi:uncharacterized protein BDCG_08994 [Blastomyces dermatitidis ER-3]|uniref:RRM domain-containing protein n=1 Tax=Ajellomyces dermatitidis (strain ER-3 / ATCC MYA-2586) TaxID=559297 RepID=A0ABP2EQ51_AJEDR|nr:uncharacterized protein BDCG_08994 [Blastomyces dermatitidis ER-3]EEQ85725.2 hypothetical protein BDCG_08994 [Blastomyces dermatitidis ER-3]
MLKPFRIRDLLDPTVDEELEQPDRSPQDGQDNPEPFLRSPFDAELMPAYKRLGNDEDGKFRPYLTHDMQSIPSMGTDGKTAKRRSDILVPPKLRSDYSDPSSGGRRNNLTHLLASAPPTTDRHGIVRISAEEYDETIAANPLAKLTYMDEDDGDTITVGSALELADRLSEPTSSAFLYSPAVPSNDREHEWPMHIFDINRSKSVLEIWRSFESRTSMGNRRLNTSVSTYHEATAPEVADDNSKAHTEPEPVFEKSNDDFRDHWLQPHKPPPFPQSTWHQNENASIGLVSSVDGGQPSELCASRNIEPVQQTSFESQHDHAKDITSDTQISIPSASMPGSNPWTSLGAWPLRLESNGLTQREPESRESPIEENLPLLASFEAELSRIMQDKLVDSSSRVTQEQLTAETSSPQPPASQPESDPSSQPSRKPAEVLGQTMQALLGGIRHLTSELRSKLPEVERRLSNAHRHIPSTVETTLFNTITAIGSHVRSLANAMQAAATSSRAAADSSREADILATNQIVNSLHTLAGDIGEMGRTLFATFDTTPTNMGSHQAQPDGELSQGNVDTHDQSNPQQCTSQPNVSVDNTAPSDSLPEVSTSRVIPESERQTASPQETPSADSNHNTTLFIGNLHTAVTEQDVETAFANKGFLGKANLPHDTATGKHAGFGYVDFPCSFAASGALQALTGNLLHGQIINLEFSHGIDTTDDSTVQQSPRQAVEVSPHPLTETNTRLRIPRHLPDIPRSRRMSSYNLTQTPAEIDASNPNGTPTGIRRAKSLGTLRRSIVHDHPRQRINTLKHITERTENQEQPNAEAPSSRRHSSNQSDQQRPKALYSADATDNNALTDQLDGEPGFSARYPSLVPDPYKYNGSQSLSPPRQGQNIARSLSPESQMARFPTVSQLEACTSTMQQSQPRDELRPSRSLIAIDGSPLNETTTSDDPIRNLRNLHPAPPPTEGRGIPGSWPPELYNAQLMGHRASSPAPPSGLRRSNTTIASDPAARLSGPFVPFTEPHPRNRNSNLRRSATERQHRRPARVSFGRHRNALEGRSVIYNPYIPQGPTTDVISNIPGSFPAEAAPAVPPKPIHQYSERQPEMQERNRLTNDIDRCVAHLGLLGYGYDSSLPSHNLHVYAEAANGNLEDAIEMIEEERKAYEQRVVIH